MHSILLFQSWEQMGCTRYDKKRSQKETGKHGEKKFSEQRVGDEELGGLGVGGPGNRQWLSFKTMSQTRFSACLTCGYQ